MASIADITVQKLRKIERKDWQPALFEAFDSACVRLSFPSDTDYQKMCRVRNVARSIAIELEVQKMIAPEDNTAIRDMFFAWRDARLVWQLK